MPYLLDCAASVGGGGRPDFLFPLKEAKKVYQSPTKSFVRGYDRTGTIEQTYQRLELIQLNYFSGQQISNCAQDFVNFFQWNPGLEI